MIDQLPYELFGPVMVLAGIGWLSLMIFPRRRSVNFWFAGIAIPLIHSAIYTYALLTFWHRPPEFTIMKFFSLPGVHSAFENRGILLVGWTDLIGMDLAVGAWMTRKAVQIRMPYLLLLPCLVSSFVSLGIGFLLFLVLAAIGRGWPEAAKFEGQPPVNAAPVAARPAMGMDS